jgi:methionyl-tRNA synthetase
MFTIVLNPKRYLITSALPYANGPLHIGHLCGAYIPADIYVRFLRLMGKDVLYICGSDENGAAITMRAKKEGVQPKEIIDKYHALFQEAFSRMGISFDIYHRTSSPLHHETAQEFFLDMYNKGEFVEEETEQYYDEKAEQFLADRYIKGNCPKCSNDSAYGDQCESCGSTLSPLELIDPVSTLTHEKPVLRKTRHWYLPLDKYEGWLRKFVMDGELDGKEHHDPSTWKNHVLGQCKSWLDHGLQPRAMTRDLEWGVDVPHEIEDAEGKKLYVWMDAPIGYISATKQWAMDHGKDWKPYWQDEESALIHFIGKDNIVFHCLIFPAILKAKGEYNLPINVPANQFMNLEGDKISTSRNWAVWVNEYVEEFEGQEDVLRYNMIRNMPEQKDSEFTWKNFQDSNNNELVNNLANFVNRVLVLTNKYYDGIVPEFDMDAAFEGVWETELGGFHETELIGLHDDIQDLNEYIRHFDFRGALKVLMEISSKGNQLLQFNEPWKLIKEDPETVQAIMNLSLQIVTAISVIIRPFMPFTSDKLRNMLNLDPIVENGELNEVLEELALGEMMIEVGHKIGKPVHLFSKIDDEVIEKQKAKLKKEEKAVEAKIPETKVEEEDGEASPEFKETIQFEDFVKLDIRTATILEAEKVKKADKLLKITLDLGGEQRIVVSGIAESYSPEEVVGRQVVYLANLAPRKIRGVESQGMILMASSKEGQLSFISPQEGWEKGSVVS